MKGVLKKISVVCLFQILTGCAQLKMVFKGKPTITDFNKYPHTLIRAAEKPFVFVDAMDNAALDSMRFFSTEPMIFGTRLNLADFLKQTKTKEFLVIQNDSIKYHYKQQGYNGGLINTFSVSKSLIGLLTGIALSEDKIHSLDDSLVQYIPETASNPAFEGITIRHLLTMRSGLQFKKLSKNILKLMGSDEALTYFTPSLRKYLLTRIRQYEPGSYWVYNNIDVELLGWVIEKAVGKSVSAYFEEKIWTKIGAAEASGWTTDDRKIERLSCCFYTNATDLAKVGRLFMDNGKINGHQIIPAAWISQYRLLDSIAVPYPPENKDIHILQQQNLWWKPIFPAAADLQANGVQGQFLYVDPESKVIIVKLSEKNTTGYPFRKIVSILQGKPYKPEVPRYQIK